MKIRMMQTASTAAASWKMSTQKAATTKRYSSRGDLGSMPSVSGAKEYIFIYYSHISGFLIPAFSCWASFVFYLDVPYSFWTTSDCGESEEPRAWQWWCSFVWPWCHSCSCIQTCGRLRCCVHHLQMRSSPTYAKHHVGKLDSLAVLLILARKKNYLGNYLQCVEGPRKKIAEVLF